MDENKFLQLSRALQALPLGDQKYNFHAVRYKFFYDNSPRKHNCTYARLTRQCFLRDGEKERLLTVLQAIPDTEQIQKILGEL